MYSKVICMASLALHLFLWLAQKFLGTSDVSLIECLGTSLLLERSNYYRFKCFVRKSTKGVFPCLNLCVPTVCLTHNRLWQWGQRVGRRKGHWYFRISGKRQFKVIYQLQFCRCAKGQLTEERIYSSLGFQRSRVYKDGEHTPGGKRSLKPAHHISPTCREQRKQI